MNGAILHARRVSRVFDEGRPGELWALNDVDLAVRPGEFVVLMGRSGSGKSTLLNLCGLLDHPDRGEVIIDSVATSSLSERRRNHLRADTIGFAFQRHHLLEHRPVVDSVALPLVYSSAPPTPAEVDRRVRASLATVGMEWAGARRPASLSGGERQRVAVARALVNAPRLLLCDEPTGQLDERNAGTVIDLLKGAAHEGTGVVLVTHDPDLAEVGDRCVRLADGVTV